MKYLLYGPGNLLVSDVVAYAVMDYAIALAQNGLADRVVVPVVGEYGEAATATILLAPAIPVLVCDAPDDVLEFDASQARDRQLIRFLQEITARTDTIRTAKAHPLPPQRRPGQ